MSAKGGMGYSPHLSPFLADQSLLVLSVSTMGSQVMVPLLSHEAIQWLLGRSDPPAESLRAFGVGAK